MTEDGEYYIATDYVYNVYNNNHRVINISEYLYDNSYQLLAITVVIVLFYHRIIIIYN